MCSDICQNKPTSILGLLWKPNAWSTSQLLKFTVQSIRHWPRSYPPWDPLHQFVISLSMLLDIYAAVLSSNQILLFRCEGVTCFFATFGLMLVISLEILQMLCVFESHISGRNFCVTVASTEQIIASKKGGGIFRPTLSKKYVRQRNVNVVGNNWPVPTRRPFLCIFKRWICSTGLFSNKVL